MSCQISYFHWPYRLLLFVDPFSAVPRLFEHAGCERKQRAECGIFARTVCSMLAVNAFCICVGKLDSSALLHCDT